MNLNCKKILCTGLMLGVAPASHAGLAAVGSNLVNDNVLNVTWTADANLLGTLEAGDAGLTAAIISDVGSITDSLGIHTLSSADFGSNGQTDWWGSLAFISYLNDTSYLGYHTWQLSDGNSLSYQFNTNLGETPGTALSNTSSNYPLFSNLQANAFWWTPAEALGTPANGVDFNTFYGYTGGADKTSQFYAWPVLPGNVTLPVPEPGSLWLFVSGVLGLCGFKRRQA